MKNLPNIYPFNKEILKKTVKLLTEGGIAALLQRQFMV